MANKFIVMFGSKWDLLGDHLYVTVSMDAVGYEVEQLVVQA